MAKKILIVEDDKFLQGLAANKLEDAGYDAVSASDGQEAITALDENQFTGVLLDLLLPDISGFDVLKNIRERSKKIPVIVFSNLSDDKDIKKAMDLGANDYMIKSNFTLDELVDKIKDIM